jgi:MOSC domain-containing protein YiiM
MTGKIKNLYLKTAHGQPMEPFTEVEVEEGKGLVGDLSYGRKKRQVLIIDTETLDHFGLQPGQVRENITVSDLALTGLSPGTRIQSGAVQLEVIGNCAPCHQIEDIRPGLRDEMENRRGLLCAAVSGGDLQVGDEIHIQQ